MLEISIHRDNDLVFDYKKMTKKAKSKIEKLAGKILEDKKLTFVFCLLVSTVAVISGLAIKDILFPVTIMCSGSLTEATNKIQDVLKEVTMFAKLILLSMCVVNTIIRVGTSYWKNGSNLKYDEVFTILFTNMALLLVGLSVDTIAFWLYDLFK